MVMTTEQLIANKDHVFTYTREKELDEWLWDEMAIE